MTSSFKASWGFAAAFALAMGIFISTLAIFRLNMRTDAEAPIAGRRSLLLAIQRENGNETRRLFDMGNGRGLVVEPSMVSAVKFGPSRYLCAFACGKYALEGESVNFPIASGSVLVAKYPNQDGTYATLETSTGAYSASTPATDPAVAAALGRSPVSPEDVIAKKYPELPLQKESCIIITMAEMILLVLCGAGFVIAHLLERRRKAA